MGNTKMRIEISLIERTVMNFEHFISWKPTSVVLEYKCMYSSWIQPTMDNFEGILEGKSNMQIFGLFCSFLDVQRYLLGVKAKD